MDLRDQRVLLVLSVVGIVVVLLVTPIVPVSYSFVFHDNYTQAAISCDQLSNSTLRNSCFDQYRYPPAALRGVTSLSYLISGLGPPPLPSTTIVTQGLAVALVHYDRSGIAYAEGPFEAPIALNPPGVVRVVDPEVLPGPNGVISFSAVITNIGSTSFQIVGAYFDYPGYGINDTVDGVVWHSGSTAAESCGDSGLAPGQSCPVALPLGPDDSLQTGAEYPLTWVVVGFDPQLPQLEPNGSAVALFGLQGARPGFVGCNFVYVQTNSVPYPGATSPMIDATWVHTFVGLVNAGRGAIPLSEDAALDAFAQSRFETAVTQYEISDFGFDAQAAAFTNGTGTVLNEEILYPNGTSPSDFVTYLRATAPGHWNELTSGVYSRYGYFVASGPAVAFSQACPVKEVIGRNVNITQLAIQNGCQYKVENELWLLIVLGS